MTYGYNGLNRRVRRTAPNGSVVHYVYQNDNLVLELDGAGNRIREYSHLPGIDRPHSMRQWANGEGGKMYYYQLQAPGHVNGLVDVARNLVNHYRYTPFGTPANGYPVEGTPNPLQYMARELDATTGLYYVRNRWYDPQLGRFVSEDPIGLAGGINKYEYVAGNPISSTDPFGLIGCQWSVRVPVYPDNIMQNGISGWETVLSGTYSWCMMALFRMQSQNTAGVDWGIRGGVHPGGGGSVTPRREPPRTSSWAQCGANAADFAISAAGDVVFFSGGAVAVTGARAYLIGRAGVTAVRSNAVRKGRGALLRRSNPLFYGGPNMFGYGASVSVGGWTSGLADDAYRSIGTGDSNWYNLLPLVGTLSAGWEMLQTCHAAISESLR